MDDIVKQAMAKWPNVPHCYGWLALDARGHWRMRDERAQALGLPGEKIIHPALLGFINRNYGSDQRGCWFFQNGPQRVYVDLEATPYIAHTDSANRFVLQAGQILADIEAVWMTENGHLLFQGSDKIAMLDDRDLAQCLPMLQMNGEVVSDDLLLSWLTNKVDKLTFHLGSQSFSVQAISDDALSAHFAYVRTPREQT